MNANGHGGRPGPGPGPGTELLISAAEYFLRKRNFDGCRKYALGAQESNRGNAAAAQILAVVDVLSASETRFNNNRPDWYAIFGVKRYSEDLQLLRNRYKNLILLLNPNKNKSSFASEAFELVRDAWSVLSNPLKKTQFDNELGMFESQSQSKTKQPRESTMEGQCGSDSGSGTKNDTFWTVCPYCYYAYEYLRVYEERCLRCQNHNCRRGFHAVAIRSPPPPAVVRNGQYWCLGFRPIGFEAGEERKRFSSWTPFSPMFMGTPQEEEEVEEEVEVEKKNNSVPQGGNGSNRDSFVHIYDDKSDNSIYDENRDSNEQKTIIDASGNKVQKEEVKGGESFDGCATSTDQREVPSVAKPVMKRKKSVARNTKKIMGKGTRIKKDETIPGHVEGLDWDMDAGEDYEDFGSGIAGGMEMGSRGDSGMDGVQFFEGEDDIFVGLQDSF